MKSRFDVIQNSGNTSDACRNYFLLLFNALAIQKLWNFEILGFFTFAPNKEFTWDNCILINLFKPL